MKREKLLKLLADKAVAPADDAKITMCPVTTGGHITEPMSRSEAFALAKAIGFAEEPKPIGQDLYAFVAVIKPALAKKILEEQNPDNRDLTQAHAQRLQSDIEKTQWVLTHEAIGFRRDGKLQDGQHRLWAVVESGLSIMALVVFNVSDRARAVIDSGKVRSATDYIRMEAGDDEVTTLVESVAVRAMAGLSRSNPNLSRTDKIELIHLYRPAIDWVMAQFPDRAKGVTNAAVLAAVTRAVHHVDDLGRLAKFCSVVRDLQPSGDPGDKTAINLGQLLRTAGTHTRVKKYTWYRYGVVCKAIRAFMAGEILEGDIKAPEKREIYQLPEDPRPIYERLFPPGGEQPPAE